MPMEVREMTATDFPVFGPNTHIKTGMNKRVE